VSDTVPDNPSSAGQPVKVFQRTKSVLAHHKPILALRWQPDGRTFLSGGRDLSLKLWDASSPGKPLRAISLDSPVFVIDARESLIAVGVEEGVSIFDLRHSERPVAEHKLNAAVHALQFNQATGLLAIGTDGGRGLIVQPTQPSHAPLLSETFPDYVRGVAWSGGGERLVLAHWTSDDSSPYSIHTSPSLVGPVDAK